LEQFAIPDDEDNNGGGSVEQFAILGEIQHQEQDVERMEEGERGEEMLQPPVGVPHILRHEQGINQRSGQT